MGSTSGSRGENGPDSSGATSRLSPDEFETMTTDLAQPLMSAALRLTRRRADAEDLVQDTLHRAWRSVSSFERGTHFKAWMFRILRNAFINRGRREAAAPVAVDFTETERPARPEPTPSLTDLRELAAMSDEYFDDCVKQAVERLPEEFRMPMVLFALGEMSYQEIADALDIPIGTVMSRLHRARGRLREELAAYARTRRLDGGRS
jgi:RNA polymerase sigma-70 factor (ECF subfamily)